MAYAVPTREQIVIRVTTDLRNQAPWLLPDTPGSLGYVLARVYAGIAWGWYWFGAWVLRQIFADSADAQYLERIASLYGIFRQVAEPAEGNVTFSGTPSTAIPSGTVVARSDGWEYATAANATIGGGGTVLVAVEAVQRGAEGNATAGTPLTLTAAIAGVDSSVTAGDLTGGEDAETDESLRVRLLGRLRDSPQGGAESDYEAWVRGAVANVERVWVFGQVDGPGTVRVYFTVTETDPLPDSGQVSDAQAAVDLRRPVTALATVSAPVANTIAMSITLGIETGAVTATVRAAAEAALRAFFRTVEPGSVVYLSQLSAAISSAAGEKWHTIASPSANVTLAANEIPVLGTVTWS